MSSSEHCQASSLLNSCYTVVIRKMGESGEGAERKSREAQMSWKYCEKGFTEKQGR